MAAKGEKQLIKTKILWHVFIAGLLRAFSFSKPRELLHHRDSSRGAAPTGLECTARWAWDPVP